MCLWFLTAGVGWEDGATILPLAKKRPEVVLLALEDFVVVLGLVLGEAAGADVLESIGAILVLVGRLLVAAPLGIESDADIFILHEG